MGYKWIFTIKYKSDGSLDIKARLITTEYTQTYGREFHETFAPMAKMNTIRILLPLATIKDWSLNWFDVKNSFLHGAFEEKVYMDIPRDVRREDRRARYVDWKHPSMDWNNHPKHGLGGLPSLCLTEAIPKFEVITPYS